MRSKALQIVIEQQLVWMNPVHNRLMLSQFVLDVGFDQFFVKHVALQQELVVLLQAAQRFGQVGWNGQQFGFLFLAPGKDVVVVGPQFVFGGVDLVDDAVQTRQQQGAHGEVGIAGGVAGAEFEAFGLRRIGIFGNADGRAAVGQAVEKLHRRFKAGQQALEAVGAGIGESHQGASVLQDAADEPDRLVGEVSVAAFLVEYVLAIFVQHHVKVHAVAGLVVNGFGHEGGREPVLQGGAADDVLHHHGVVADLGEGQQFRLDLLLRAQPHLVVVVAHLDPLLFHAVRHFLADLVVAVERRVHVIAFSALLGHGVVIFKIQGQGVFAFRGGHGVAAGIFVAVVFHGVEEVELQFRNPGAVVGNTGGFEVILSPQGHAAGVFFHADAGFRVADGADEAQGGGLEEGVDVRRVCVRHQHHVSGFHGAHARDGGAVEGHAQPQNLIQPAGREGDVVPASVHAGVLQVDRLDVVFFDQFDDFVLVHAFYPWMFFVIVFSGNAQQAHHQVDGRQDQPADDVQVQQAGYDQNAEEHVHAGPFLGHPAPVGVIRQHHAQNLASVQRRNRDQVEKSQQQVEKHHHLKDVGQQLVAGAEVIQQREHDGDQQVRSRPGQRRKPYPLFDVFIVVGIERHRLSIAPDHAGREIHDQRQDHRTEPIDVLERVQAQPAGPFGRVVAQPEGHHGVAHFMDDDRIEHDQDDDAGQHHFDGFVRYNHLRLPEFQKLAFAGP